MGMIKLLFYTVLRAETVIGHYAQYERNVIIFTFLLNYIKIKTYLFLIRLRTKGMLQFGTKFSK